MRRLPDRFPRNLKAVLSLEVLEGRVPVSENIGMLTMLATAGGAAALASKAQALPHSSRDAAGWSPREVTPPQQIALMTAKASPPAAVQQAAVVQPPPADLCALPVSCHVSGLNR